MDHIVFLDRASLVAELRRPDCLHHWTDWPETAAEQTAERLAQATIAVTNKVKITREVLVQTPKLKMVAVAATGVDNVDLAACRERGVAVCNIRGYAEHTVPEHVFMLLLALRRNLIAYRDSVQRGEWAQSNQFCLFAHDIRDLHSSTLGIVGHGSIGSGIEGLARAFGMHVLLAEHKDAHSRRPGYTAFDDVLRRADAITLHTPLIDETKNLIGPREFGLMKRNAVLINTARGGLVDETALIEALRTGRIAGAGFDVLSAEPPTTDHPLLKLNLPNFLLTPHVAWSSREAMQRLADQLIENIEAFVSGAPRNLVG